MPPGPDGVTMEGRLITDVLRRESGHVLIEIPGMSHRPTQVKVHIEMSEDG